MISNRLRAVALVLVFAVAATGLVRAQVVTSGGIVVATLKQQLETGLLARTPSEQAFVNEVVALVNSGDLPISLVQSTFLWARRKGKFPMPYFERALRLRASAIGIDF
jgi:hypothetical protein